MKRTAVAALAGRVIESVTVFHGGFEDPLSLEIRCVGGMYFCFDASAQVQVKVSSLLADNRTGELRNERRRTFKMKGVFPYGEEE